MGAGPSDVIFFIHTHLTILCNSQCHLETLSSSVRLHLEGACLSLLRTAARRLPSTLGWLLHRPANESVTDAQPSDPSTHLAFLLAGFSAVFFPPSPSATLSTPRFSPVSALSCASFLLAGLPDDLSFSVEADLVSFLLAGLPDEVVVSFLLAGFPDDFGFSLAPFLLAGFPPLSVLSGSWP